MTEEPQVGSARSRLQALLDPFVLRGALALVGGTIFFIAAANRGALLEIIIAAGAGVYLITIVLGRRGTDRPSGGRLQRLLGAVAAVLLIAVFAFGSVWGFLILEFGLAVAILIGTMAQFVGAVRMRRKGCPAADWTWLIVRGVGMLVLGVLLFVWPGLSLTFVVGMIGLAWAFSGGIVVVAVARGQQDEIQDKEPYQLAIEWLQRREFSAEDRRDLVDRVFFDGVDLWSRIRRFSALMAFSVIIATLGVIQNSTAVVIGAMLVAPLMTPMMGLALATVMGWPKRGLRSLGLVAIATVGAVATAALLTRFVPLPGDVLNNTEILSRTSPTIIDLLIALTAGAAGAFATARRDVSDSLPGVAIAVALVPPLSVVGVTLAQGDLSAAWGAMLLYLTNFVSIVLAGAVVFVTVGASPFFRLRQQAAEIRIAVGTFLVAAALIAVPLGISTQQILQQERQKSVVDAAVRDWVGEDRSFSISSIQVRGDSIDVRMDVSGGLPGIESLGAALEEELYGPFTLNVYWRPETVLTYESDSGS